jgi:hypothetical protein
MKKILLVATAFFFIAAANAQLYGKKTEVKDANDRYPINDTSMMLPEGTALKNGKVMLANGYRTVYLDSSRVIVVQKSNGETTGAFRCSCTTNAGESRIALAGNEIHCINGCSMDVAPGRKGNTSVTPSGHDWKKLILSRDNIKRLKTEN